MTRHAAVLLDLDQTLIDSRESIIQPMQRVFKQELGIELRRQSVLDIWGIPLNEQFLALAGPNHAGRLVSAYREIRHQQGHLLTVYAGWPETLSELRARRYSLAIVTSRHNSTAKWCLEQVGLGGIFDAVVGVDDVTARKPDPQPFLLAAQLIGAEPSACLAVGDSPLDIIGAKRAGMTAALAEWDFLASGIRPPAVEDPAATPDIRLAAPGDLLPHCPPLVG